MREPLIVTRFRLLFVCRVIFSYVEFTSCDLLLAQGRSCCDEHWDSEVLRRNCADDASNDTLITLRKVLVLDPALRPTAAEVLQDPWLLLGQKCKVAQWFLENLAIRAQWYKILESINMRTPSVVSLFSTNTRSTPSHFEKLYDGLHSRL